MAGKPRQRAVIQELERRTRETMEDESATHLDFVVEWVEGGGQLNDLMREISDRAGYGAEGLNAGMLRRYLCSMWTVEQVDARLARARVVGSHAKVEQAQQIIEDASAASRESLAHAKMKSDVRLWHAERINKTELGRGADVQVIVNNNTLHLDAMRQRSTARAALVKETAGQLAADAGARLIGVRNPDSSGAGSIDPDIVDATFEINSLLDNDLANDAAD